MVEKVVILAMIFPLLIASCSKGKIEKKGTSKGITGNVYIVPKYATTNNDLGIIVNLNLAKEDTIKKSYKWFKNGRLISEDSILPRNTFIKGDTIKATVSINGKEFETDNVIIRNSAPVIYSAQIVKDSTFLKVTGNANDADEDSITLFIKWYNDKNLIGKGKIIPLSKVGNTSNLYALVTPYDGTDSGSTYKTTTIAVVNSAPIITSSPPTHLTGGKFIYQVKAKDPDGDPITFSLVDPPKGASIDSKNGTVKYTVPPEILGSINFTIKASDNHGNYSLQKFSYTIK